MRSVRRLLLPALLTLVLAGLGLRDAAPAGACASSSETVAISTRHPDLPLTGFVKGELGLLQPTFARSYLLVAYRWLSGRPLDPQEQAAMIDLYKARLSIDGNLVAPAPPGPAPPPPPDVVAIWDKERARILGAGGPATRPGYNTPSYQAIDNCLEDAFRVATDTLRDREAKLPAAELAAWVAAQDAVFKNCPDPKQRSIPQPASAQAPALARADRAYQAAAAYFYSNQWDEAERRFRAVGADRASPWARLGRYMVPRVMVRRALLAHDKADRAELARALADVDRQLADADMAPLHQGLRRYRSFVRAKVEPAKLLADDANRIAMGGTGAALGDLARDYLVLLDQDDSVLRSAPESDGLTSFLGAMQGRRSFDFAKKMYDASNRSVPWLVAGLVTATNAADPRVDPLLAHALAVQPDSPAFATVRYHFFRLAAARGMKTSLFDRIQWTRSQLAKAGPSTRNAFTSLAVSAAPDMGAFLREATVVPAGTSDDFQPVIFDAKRAQALPPEVVDMIEAGLPLSMWKDASLSPVLPGATRAHVAATTWTRAHLVGDRAVASAVSPVVTQLNPATKAYVDRVEGARTDDERRLALVYALLRVPSLGPGVEAWYATPATEEDISSSYGRHFWCAASAPKAAPAAPSFANPADRAAAEKERAALVKLGAGATWLANEAARLADVLPSDPRVPEALHLAVRATRFGCKDDHTQEASKRAFAVLHKKYDGTKWAKATPYYY